MTDFVLPHDLEASAPPTARDGVRLLVASPDGMHHARFAQIADFLSPGDLLVVNTSATLAAAVDGTRADGTPVTVHFSTPLDDAMWVVEVRPAGPATGPIADPRGNERITLTDGAILSLVAPYPHGTASMRLWFARVAVEGGVGAYLARVGRPIHYAYVPRDYPLAEYQTAFAHDPGSAEMPSAGRPFTPELVTELVARGVAVAPVTLHTGVSSQEDGEPPLPERFRVPIETARLVEHTRRHGGRVVAVGTTVTRALESASRADGHVHEAHGWTELVLGPKNPARVVTGLITGWHAPGASHLQLLEAVAGAELVDRAYEVALRDRYLWHEFGDSCLLLP
jgi:S-adenosylmethionine:tRNA ribosyltransferase-isomerase